MKKGINSLFSWFYDFIYFSYKFLRKTFLLSALFIFALIFFSNLVINFYSNDRIFYSVSEIPSKKTALVLGTSKYLIGSTKQINLFYKERIKAANDLFESGKVETLILSGTNDSKYYNEPETMKKDLMDLGIPENKLYLDYAGFRTLDSVVRTKEIFSQSDLIIVSQKFHLQRAIFIAGLNNMEAVGYAAQDPPFLTSAKIYLREIFSRINLLFDILFQREPRFYGPKVKIN
jgi:SanA protein